MPIKVFFNNSCNICKMEIDHYKKNSDENLEWVDITNNQEAINLTSKSQANLSFSTKLKSKLLTKPSFRILTKIQLRNLNQTSAAKY